MYYPAGLKLGWLGRILYFIAWIKVALCRICKMKIFSIFILLLFLGGCTVNYSPDPEKTKGKYYKKILEWQKRMQKEMKE